MRYICSWCKKIPNHNEPNSRIFLFCLGSLKHLILKNAKHNEPSPSSEKDPTRLTDVTRICSKYVINRYIYFTNHMQNNRKHRKFHAVSWSAINDWPPKTSRFSKYISTPFPCFTIYINVFFFVWLANNFSQNFS